MNTNYNEQIRAFNNRKAQINNDCEAECRKIMSKAHADVAARQEERNNKLRALARERDQYEDEFRKWKQAERIREAKEIEAARLEMAKAEPKQ